MQHHVNLFALKVSRSLCCVTFVSHGVCKHFPQAVEYGPLRCYFYVVDPVRGDVKLLCTSVVQ